MRSGRQRLALAAGLAFLVVAIVFWIYAFFVYDPGRKVDELADRTFPRAAEQVCAATMAQLDRLPPATEARTPEERAEVIDRSDEMLRDMADRLEALVPQGKGRITSGIQEWVDDWRTHIADRSRYADALREDPGARFLESTKGNRQVSRAIDGFAEVNRMESCRTRDDVG